MSAASAPVLSTPTEFDRVQLVIHEKSRGPSELRTAYSLDEVAAEVISGGYKSVALQFPDDLLFESAAVSEILQSSIQLQAPDSIHKIYILADTSYSPCCVDEVASQHVNADVVVHFGNSCLSPVQKVPVIYVMGGILPDRYIQSVEDKLRNEFTDHSALIILVSETHYSGVLRAVYDRIREDYPNCIVTDVIRPEEVGDDLTTPTPVSFVPSSKDNYNLDSATGEVRSEFLPTRKHLPLTEDLKSYKAFFLTSSSPSPSFVLHLSTLVESVSILDIQSPPDQTKITTPRSILQKRYRYMNVARTASTIGILVNTLSLRNVNSVLAQVKSWISQAGKKYYTFVVGKPNVAKLANFDVVDMWVVLGCPLGGIIVDCDDFYKPIITPYELSLALQSEVSWTGKWEIDFETVFRVHVPLSGDDEGDDDEGAPVFDPISGSYISTSRPLRRAHIEIRHEQEPSESAKSDTQPDDSNSTTALATRMTSQLAIRGTVSTAAEYLHSKTSWQGLGSDLDAADTDGAVAKPGREGIARGYRVSDSDRT